MQKLKDISVVETLGWLRQLQHKNPSRFKPLQMLIIIKQQGNMSKYDLASLLASSQSSVGRWRRIYITDGIEGILAENRGGKKRPAITRAVHDKLSRRLNDPKGGFRSFTEIQQWLEDYFNITMNYHAVNKYVKRKFGARLKVSRKSHVLKTPADEAVFKKPV